MNERLKTLFPSYNINDASGRSFDEILKIIEICHAKPNLLVFINRNSKNDNFFKFTEDTQKAEKLNLIFLNKDDIYYYFVEEEYKENIIMSLKRKIDREINCNICFEKCIDKYYICLRCGMECHVECLNKSGVQQCPHCKYNKMMTSK